MGDRCSMTISVREADSVRFIQAVKDAIYEPDNVTEGDAVMPWADLNWDDVNYAAGIAPGDLGRLKGAESIPFYGSHDAGGCYQSGVFANDGEGRFALCYEIGGSPAARLSESGDIDPDDAQAAKEYFSIVRKITNQS